MTPKKYPQNFIPKKFLFFLKTQKNIEIQNFEPQKMDQAYVCMKISEDPPPGPPPPITTNIWICERQLSFYVFSHDSLLRIDTE